MTALKPGEQIRIEVNVWENGERRDHAIYVTIPDLTDDERAFLKEKLDQVLDQMRQDGIADPPWALLGAAVERHIDEAAYRREAERRGVLAL